MCGNGSGACPKDLLVADLMRHLMYAESYGQFSLGRENCQLLAPDHPGSVRCPNGVAVMGRLIRAQEMFG